VEFNIEFDREADGRWIAEIKSLPGVLYGKTEKRQSRRSKLSPSESLPTRIEREKSATRPSGLLKLEPLALGVSRLRRDWAGNDVQDRQANRLKTRRPVTIALLRACPRIAGKAPLPAFELEKQRAKVPLL
jgi:hypothetical protein